MAKYIPPQSELNSISKGRYRTINNPMLLISYASSMSFLVEKGIMQEGVEWWRIIFRDMAERLLVNPQSIPGIIDQGRGASEKVATFYAKEKNDGSVEEVLETIHKGANLFVEMAEHFLLRDKLTLFPALSALASTLLEFKIHAVKFVDDPNVYTSKDGSFYIKDDSQLSALKHSKPTQKELPPHEKKVWYDVIQEQIGREKDEMSNYVPTSSPRRFKRTQLDFIRPANTFKLLQVSKRLTTIGYEMERAEEQPDIKLRNSFLLSTAADALLFAIVAHNNPTN